MEEVIVGNELYLSFPESINYSDDEMDLIDIERFSEAWKFLAKSS